MGFAVKSISQDFPYRWMVDLIVYFAMCVLLRIGGIPGRKLALTASIAQVAAPVGVLVRAFAGYMPAVDVALAIEVCSLSSAGGPGVWPFSRRVFEMSVLSSLLHLHAAVVIFGSSYIVLYHWRRSAPDGYGCSRSSTSSSEPFRTSSGDSSKPLRADFLTGRSRESGRGEGLLSRLRTLPPLWTTAVPRSGSSAPRDLKQDA